MKGSLSLNPKFTPYNLKNVKILKLNPLIVFDDHHLYLKNHSQQNLKVVKWEDKNIVNCTYLKNYKIILLLCQNYRVYALTQNLEQICNISGWQSKYTLAFQVIQELGIILLIGAQSVEILRIAILTNIKKTKFLSSIKFSLKHLSTILQPNQVCKLSWFKGYHVNLKETLLVIWSPDSVVFYNLSNLQFKSQIHSLTKKEHPITEVYFSSNYKYTVTGISSGQIRVWRLPLSKKFDHQHVLIHTFDCHTKSITKIIQSNIDERIIISSGEDMLVCVWSLQTFEMLRKYDFLGIYSQIYLRNMQEAYVVKDSVVGFLNFGHLLNFVTQMPSQIIYLDKFSSQNNCKQIALTMDSNLGLVLSTNQLLNSKDLNKIQIKNVYPPLKAKTIKQIISSPYEPNIYFLIVQNGQLFKISTETNTSKILEVFLIQRSIDRQKHQLNQIPSYISFLPVVPMQFDSQIIDGSEKQKIDAKDLAKMTSFQIKQFFLQMKFIAIGCNKGSIIFLRRDNLQKIYSRLTYHREKIIYFDVIKQFKDANLRDINHKNYIMVSCCIQKHLKLVKFNYQEQICQCYLTYYFGQQLKFFKTFDIYLSVIFYKGEFQIAFIDLLGKNQQICIQNSKQIQNHEGQILTLDYQQKQQIVLTAGSDNKIKLWTIKKILLYQIVLDDGLSHSSFISHFQINSDQINLKEQEIEEQKKIKKIKNIPVKFDLLILHMGKLLVFRQIPLAFKKNEIQDLNNRKNQEIQQKISIREVIQAMQSLNYKSKNQIEINRIQKLQFKQESPNKKRKIKTEVSQQYIDSSPIKSLKSPKRIKQYQYNGTPEIKKKQINLKTESSQRAQIVYSNLSTKKSRPTVLKPIQSQHKSFSYKKQLQQSRLIPISSLEATKKHLAQLSALKGLVNRPILPKISFKTQQVFDQFMRDKLANKNILTRRDITLNRIIMKNIIKEHFQQETKYSGLKLDF